MFKYAICVANYNMAGTLSKAITSIADQVTPEDYQIVIIDDGSSDRSCEIIQSLAQTYENISYKFLPRDPNRRLGNTRNVASEIADAEYLILQMDCDDVYQPHIMEFVFLVRELEGKLDKDYFFKGNKLNVIKKSLFDEVGGYQNIFRGEDRELWGRLAHRNQLIFINHEPIHTRLDKGLNNSNKLWTYVYNEFDHSVNNLRGGGSFIRSIVNQFNPKKPLTLKKRVVKLILALPVLVKSWQMGSLPYKGDKIGNMNKYRDENTIDFVQYFDDQELDEIRTKLTLEAQKAFLDV